MVKKLRYYARFIVVCLLLKKMKLVRELVIELERQIQEYTSTYVVARGCEDRLLLSEFTRTGQREKGVSKAAQGTDNSSKQYFNSNCNSFTSVFILIVAMNLKMRWNGRLY